MKWIAILMSLGAFLGGLYLQSENVFEAAGSGNVYTLISRSNSEAVQPSEGFIAKYVHRATALVTEARRTESEAAKIRLSTEGLHYLLTARDPSGNSVLHWAVRSRDGDTLAFVLGLKEKCSNEVDAKLFRDLIQSKNSNGSTALHWACQSGSAAAVESLINAGIDTNVANSNGETPLHWAVDWQNQPMVRTLLRHGASAIAVDKDLNTPLHKIPQSCAESNDCAMIVSLLLKAGANAEAENVFKRKAMQHFDTSHAPPPEVEVEEAHAERKADTTPEVKKSVITEKSQKTKPKATKDSQPGDSEPKSEL